MKRYQKYLVRYETNIHIEIIIFDNFRNLIMKIILLKTRCIDKRSGPHTNLFDRRRLKGIPIIFCDTAFHGNGNFLYKYALASFV